MVNEDVPTVSTAVAVDFKPRVAAAVVATLGR